MDIGQKTYQGSTGGICADGSGGALSALSSVGSKALQISLTK